MTTIRELLLVVFVIIAQPILSALNSLVRLQAERDFGEAYRFLILLILVFIIGLLCLLYLIHKMDKIEKKKDEERIEAIIRKVIQEKDK